MLQVRFTGVRARILAIALIPSVVLLAIGGIFAGYLAIQGQHARNYAEIIDRNMQWIRSLIVAVEQEEIQSIWRLAGNDRDPRVLADARANFDKSLQAIGPVLADYRALGTLQDSASAAFDQLRTQLPLIRQGVDNGTLPIADAYHFYGVLLQQDSSFDALAKNKSVPDATSALQMEQTANLLHVISASSSAEALTIAAASPAGLPAPLLEEYRDQVGYYHASIGQLASTLDAADNRRAQDIAASPAWQQMGVMEDALLRPEFTKYGNPAPLPMSINDWRHAADQVSQQLVALWVDTNVAAMNHMRSAAADRADNSLLAGGSLAGFAIVTFVLSLWLANRLIGRLRRLRTETLALADEHLPETMRKLTSGEPVDLEKDTTTLDFGTDEIGSVADAFNRAHTAAVGAAVTEARTREGVRAVFLNIAHRSQIVVHRQLEILDEAERRQEDPALLEIFFRLDHLATRERRNAENLVILGGGQPGRKWRRPVALLELVRGAVAETLDYARVQTGRLPEVFVVGTVVADLIHLLAELVDNATSFSPPQSRVEVSGTVVGKGVVVEISDQGMGMAPDDLERANTMLTDPPDFGVATLSVDSRLGLFVVAQLAQRHRISVRLSDSDYGGIRAIVLIPNTLTTTEPNAVDRLPQYLYGHRADTPPPVAEIPGGLVGEIPALSQTRPDPAPTPVATLPPTRSIPEGPRHPNPANTQPPEAPPYGSRPALPKRRRQASLAPELAKEQAPQKDSGSRRARTAEQARNLMSAIENGTRQGRQAEADPYPTSRMTASPPTDEQDGEGDFFSRK